MLCDLHVWGLSADFKVLYLYLWMYMCSTLACWSKDVAGGIVYVESLHSEIVYTYFCKVLKLKF